MNKVALSSVAKVIRGVTFSKSEGITTPSDDRLPVIRAGSIQKSLLLDEGQIWVPANKIKPNQIIRKNDIVMCTSSGSSDLVGKCAKSSQNWNGSFGAFCAGIRADESKCSSSYLYHFLNSPHFRNWTQLSSGANIKNIRASELAAFEIPLPPLEEQKRIAAILDKADAIRRKRQQAIDLTDQLLRSVFLDMFGDPVTNPKGWETSKLGDLVKVISGGTPSKRNKSFWEGDYPWVSPKDMKVTAITDSQDHISEVVFDKTNQKKIPPNSILVVVRGMILAHTVPVGITARSVAINQDIKAMLPNEKLNPIFMLYCLKAMHSHLLSKVSTAAHGTKRIEMDDLFNLDIILPNNETQTKFAAIVDAHRKLLGRQTNQYQESAGLFNSLTQRAFRGELFKVTKAA